MAVCRIIVLLKILTKFYLLFLIFSIMAKFFLSFCINSPSSFKIICYPKRNCFNRKKNNGNLCSMWWANKKRKTLSLRTKVAYLVNTFHLISNSPYKNTYFPQLESYTKKTFDISNDHFFA